MSKLYSSLVRPILDYGAPFWSPHLARDIDVIESVQRNFTKQIQGFSNLTYDQRRERLDLFSLEHRRKRGELIEAYKIIRDLPDASKDLFYFSDSNRTRGNQLKMTKRRFFTDVGKYAFSNRIVDNWNKLSDDIISAPTTTLMKRRLDVHLSERRITTRY